MMWRFVTSDEYHSGPRVYSSYEEAFKMAVAYNREDIRIHGRKRSIVYSVEEVPVLEEVVR